jgi:hypothetical protein
VTLPKVVLPISALSGLKDLFDIDVTMTGRNYARFRQLSTADLGEVLDLDGEVREIGKVRELLPIMQGFTGLRCRHGNNRAEMARSEPPEVQVGDLVALAFDCSPDFVGHAAIGHSIQQDGAGISQ